MLTLWTPRQLSTFERLFDDFFKTSDLSQYHEKTYSPNINVRETKDKVIIEAELAGLEKEAVKVKFENGALKISGERKFGKKAQDEKYYAVEISSGSFERIIPIDENFIKADTIKANFKNGILTVELDKAEEKKAKEIEVQIS
ncbi:MAG: Hsp20/alpha crystallin family protein [Candidatus Margulisiibacteriota bacterium]|nr:MAG: hypothetical protein A2X43_01900 [Candidatus Margulisbacteria bacterium GWD2_39_127]OGI01328.1 MAG: hypothetical protein A2X42_06545 [Candidatus Margulisbacteria bacterium GWF2_38_17]OGI10792.1 MAG: hypothetical protein A2X41_00800 [Candidatus Margulisbacteria bacterium GWE2_39_32]PZM79396.1 MAG: Hsp20/alpha crystallin family protein [Candidatus Margulisiibacteriota bacterium]HAR63554.1 Hsp20/alpha crystallin family protein [Candidatus Margulisiibacteriota bacterium]